MRLLPGVLVQTAGSASSSARSIQRRRATSSTRRNIALRTITRKARALPVIGRGWLGGVARADRRGLLGAGVGQLLPLVEQAGVGLAHDLAEPLDEVGQLLGLWRCPGRSAAAPCRRR